MIPAGLLLTGFVLRLYFFLDPSLWADEGPYFWAAQQKNLRDILTVYGTTATDTPLATYVFLWVWARLAGTSLAALRLFSVVVSSLSIGTTGLAAWWISRRRPAVLLAMGLAAMNPYSIRYGYDLTAYCVLNLVAPLSIGLCIAETQRTATPRYARFLLTNALLLNIHYYAYFLVLAETLLLCWIHRRHWRSELPRLAAATAVYVAASLPVLYLFDPGTAARNHAWILQDPRGLPSILAALFGYSPSFQAVGIALVGGLAGVCYWGRKRIDTADRAALGSLAFLAAATVAFAALVGCVLWRILGHERYLMVVFPAFVLFAAVAVTRALPCRARAAVGFALLLHSGAGVVWTQPSGSVQDFRGAVAFIEAESGNEPTDLLLVPQCCSWALSYYMDLRGLSLIARTVDPDRFLSEDTYRNGALATGVERANQRVFVVLYYAGLQREDQFRKHLEYRLNFRGTARFAGVNVMIFQRPGS